MPLPPLTLLHYSLILPNIILYRQFSSYCKVLQRTCIAKTDVSFCCCCCCRGWLADWLLRLQWTVNNKRRCTQQLRRLQRCRKGRSFVLQKLSERKWERRQLTLRTAPRPNDEEGCHSMRWMNAHAWVGRSVWSETNNFGFVLGSSWLFWCRIRSAEFVKDLRPVPLRSTTVFDSH